MVVCLKINCLTPGLKIVHSAVKVVKSNLRLTISYHRNQQDSIENCIFVPDEPTTYLMISEKKLKAITALSHKKYRQKNGLFILEGEKIILDAMAQARNNLTTIKELFVTAEWLRNHPSLIIPDDIEIQTASEGEMKKITSLVTPQGILAVAEIPGYQFSEDIFSQDIVLAFDRIRDPGNLGTIIRTADWFGLNNIVCSADSVDCYNPKVVQSSMGAILRTRVFYRNLAELSAHCRHNGVTVAGTTLTGKAIYEAGLKAPMLLISGNESSGISQELLEILDYGITIPGKGSRDQKSESLNVASAVAIVCAEIRRQASAVQ